MLLGRSLLTCQDLWPPNHGLYGDVSSFVKYMRYIIRGNSLNWNEDQIKTNKQREVGEHFLGPCGNSVLVLSVLGMKERGADSRELCAGSSEELMGEHHVQAMLKQSGGR